MPNHLLLLLCLLGAQTLNAAGEYLPIGRPRRLPHEVARMLVGEILDGRSRAGDRLPTEQRLAIPTCLNSSSG